jgi:ABC-type multidrug transport system fused ATPase/permease subunit
MIATFVRFRSYLAPYRRLLAVGALLATLDIGFGLAQPWPLKVAVDQVILGHPPGGLLANLPVVSRQVELALIIAVLVAIVGIGALADYWSTWLMESAGQRIGNDIREALFSHLQRLSLRYHDRQHVGDLATRLTSDVDRVQDLLVQSLSVLIPNGFLVAGMIAVMLYIDPVFTLLALSATPLLVLAIYRTTNAMKWASRRARRSGGMVAAIATENLGAIEVVQAFGLESRVENQFQAMNRASLDASLKALLLQARSSPLVDLAAVIATSIALWFGVNRVLDGRMTLGVLLVFLAYLASLFRPVKALSRLGYVISRGVASGERIAGVLAETPDVTDHPAARPAPRFRGQIEFRRVTFSYGREPVLRDVNLDLNAGEVVALVGRTGAGKSTLAALIPRLYDPDGGIVAIDDRDIRDYTLGSLRTQVAVVLQEAVLFRGTIAENIAWGRPGAVEAEISDAARLALVDEFSDRLPEGMDTMVGERGAALSGGQRQRIAIARAIIRDAAILVLDEPTSALDAASEALVIKALHNLMQGRTTLVIAHRLSTIRGADRIAVLDRGRVVEEGTHQGLLARSGLYASLYQAGMRDAGDGDQHADEQPLLG